MSRATRRADRLGQFPRGGGGRLLPIDLIPWSCRCRRGAAGRGNTGGDATTSAARGPCGRRRCGASRCSCARRCRGCCFAGSAWRLFEARERGTGNWRGPALGRLLHVQEVQHIVATAIPRGISRGRRCPRPRPLGCRDAIAAALLGSRARLCWRRGRWHGSCLLGGTRRPPPRRLWLRMGLPRPIGEAPAAAARRCRGRRKCWYRSSGTSC
mmetsp:Transcript_8085/g.17536  ORF Transcript_8085/g.17536 Transcript_8085/m.17536 type:complete len:212 (+) Transcript_8085:215-850(+)